MTWKIWNFQIRNFFTYAKNETFANQTNKKLGAKIQRRKKWILWRKNSNIHRKNNCYFRPKMRYFELSFKDCVVFPYRHYWIWFTEHFCSYESLSSDWRRSEWLTNPFLLCRCCSFDSSDPPSSNRKAHRFTLCRSSNGFLPSVEAKKKKWKCSSPCFHLVCKKVIDRRRPLLNIVPKVHLFVQKLLYNLHGKLRKLGWLDFFRLECVVWYRLKYSKSTFGAKNGVKK